MKEYLLAVKTVNFKGSLQICPKKLYNYQEQLLENFKNVYMFKSSFVCLQAAAA